MWGKAPEKPGERTKNEQSFNQASLSIRLEAKLFDSISTLRFCYVKLSISEFKKFIKICYFFIINTDPYAYSAL